MKFLLLSDVESPALWEFFTPDRLNGIDLIISCGDLKSTYLEFLVTMGSVPVFYVPGNHDLKYLSHPPEGCECIDDRVLVYRGIRILGLGGCINYNNNPYQYTEEEMAKRIARMRRALKKIGGVDVVITHAPIAGFGDQEDRAHRGFACFREIVETYHPAYFIHGHVHRNYGANVPRILHYNGTEVINAYERYVLEVPDELASRPAPVRRSLFRRLAGG